MTLLAIPLVLVAAMLFFGVLVFIVSLSYPQKDRNKGSKDVSVWAEVARARERDYWSPRRNPWQ